ncbi:MAG: hypothetical protein HW421_217 [Ignavibacteria bacterium]|nr:hypothetical protein [Ignavibacteria bacterium]
MENLYEKIIELRKNNRKSILCTMTSHSGSTPRKTGSKMLVTDTGEIFGTIGGGLLEKNIIEESLKLTSNPEPKLFRYNLTKDLGMTCGGSVEVFCEPLFSNLNLYIFGGGHIGKSLAGLVENLNFNITVIDERTEIFETYGRTSAVHVSKQFEEFIEETNFGETSFIVIVTKGHETDFHVIKSCINKQYAYMGMIGSKRKVEEMRKKLINENIATLEQLNNIDMPIGIDIMAESPDEIAISIAAKLILEKNKLLKK